MALNNDFQKDVAALGEVAQSARSLAHQLTFPDADKIKATTENAAETAQIFASAASTINQRLSALRLWHLVVIAELGILYFAGGACFVWNDHHASRRLSTNMSQPGPSTPSRDSSLTTSREHLGNLKAFLDTGIRVSVEQDNVSGDTVLTLGGRPTVFPSTIPATNDGKYSINVVPMMRSACSRCTSRRRYRPVFGTPLTHGLPYYYDAGILSWPITGAVMLVDISSTSRARRPRRIIRDGEDRTVVDCLRLSPDRLPGRTLEMGYRRILYSLADYRRYRRGQDELRP